MGFEIKGTDLCQCRSILISGFYDFMHGPIAIINGGFPVMAVVPHGTETH